MFSLRWLHKCLGTKESVAWISPVSCVSLDFRKYSTLLYITVSIVNNRTVIIMSVVIIVGLILKALKYENSGNQVRLRRPPNWLLGG